MERGFHIGIFDPALGGDPILFQHMFWFYSHPAVYIMILPGMGVISELITCFSHKRIFGYKFVAFVEHRHRGLRIPRLGRTICSSPASVIYAAMVFSLLSFIVAIPSAIKVFNWTATMYKGSISLDTPMLYAFGFIGLFTIGGLTGLFLASLGLDVHLTDTYFIIAHFHYIMVGGMVLAYLGGAALLVAEDDRPHVSGIAGEARRADRLRRIQPDILPAIHAGISGNAAPLSRLSAGIPSVERAVFRGRVHPGSRLPAAHDLSAVVAEVRQDRGPESLAGHRTRVGDIVTAAYA